MINQISITGFKSLERVDIPLGRVNVFVGANGSGKSNVLEAVGMLSAAAEGRVDAAALGRRGMRLGEPGTYSTRFRSDAPEPVVLRATTNEAEYAVSLANPLDDPQPAWRYATESLLVGDLEVVARTPRTAESFTATAGLAALERVQIDPASPAAALLDRLQNYRIHAPGTLALRGQVADTFQADPVGLGGGRLAEAVQELFEAMDTRDPDDDDFRESLLEMIPWARGVAAVPSSEAPLAREVPAPRVVLAFEDRHMTAGARRLTGYDASEGALYVLFAAVLALHPRAPQLVAVDNFDQALNPRLARKLTRFLCEETHARAPARQLMLTCHNPLVLDGLPLRDDDVRLFTVDRDLHGRTQVNRVEVDDALLAKSKEGWTLSRMWIMGMLGGVPDV